MWACIVNYINSIVLNIEFCLFFRNSVLFLRSIYTTVCTSNSSLYLLASIPVLQITVSICSPVDTKMLPNLCHGDHSHNSSLNTFVSRWNC